MPFIRLEAVVATDDFELFIQDCLVIEEDAEEGLSLDALYGLYLSWSRLTGHDRLPEGSFVSSLHRHRLHWGRRQGRWVVVGLRMVGPAARDYVLCSAGPWNGIDDKEAAETPSEAA